MKNLKRTRKVGQVELVLESKEHLNGCICSCFVCHDGKEGGRTKGEERMEMCQEGKAADLDGLSVSMSLGSAVGIRYVFRCQLLC